VFDLATRAYNHSYKIDPIIRSLLDTDFYKFLMLQFIWRQYRDVPVTFSLINRTTAVRLAEIIDEQTLRAQLDHVREIRFRPSELIWLAGNTFYGTAGMFEPAFLEWLAAYRLPPYHLKTTEDGQYQLTFSGGWADVTLWEIPCVAIVNTLRNRAALARMSRLELDVLYAQAKTNLWRNLQLLRDAGVAGISDFSTRRRHEFLYQEWAVLAAKDVLGTRFSGTSNVLLAMRHDLEAIGTNAHELQMVVATLSDTHEEMRASQYTVLQQWQETYGGRLLVMLPDTFGTTQFLAGAPDWLADWTGMRIDSKDPVTAGEEAIGWWRSRGRDPRHKLLLFSDALDTPTMIGLRHHFADRTRTGFGWGTLFTNDFRGCHPRGAHDLDPISLICKVTMANGKPAVKLSDNTAKPTGPPPAVEAYRKVFGTAGQGHRAVLV
jgi:nicotinate phosphoribosyltransferase